MDTRNRRSDQQPVSQKSRPEGDVETRKRIHAVIIPSSSGASASSTPDDIPDSKKSTRRTRKECVQIRKVRIHGRPVTRSSVRLATMSPHHRIPITAEQKTSSGQKRLLKTRGTASGTQGVGIKSLASRITRIQTIGEYGSGPGVFLWPRGLTINHRGELVVVDSGNYRLQILSWEGDCKSWLTFPELCTPFDVAVSTDGIYYITNDTNILVCSEDTFITRFPKNHVISPKGITLTNDGKHVLITDCPSDERHSVKKYTTDGEYVSQYQPMGDLELKSSWYLTVSSSNHVIVSDWGNCRIQVLDSELQFVKSFHCEDENGIKCEPRGVAIDGEDKLYVCDREMKRILIYDKLLQLIDKVDDVRCFAGIVISRDTPMKIAVTGWHKIKVLYL